MKTVLILVAVCFVCSTTAIAQMVEPKTGVPIFSSRETTQGIDSSEIKLRQAQQTIQELRQQIARKDAEIKVLQQRASPHVRSFNDPKSITGQGVPLMIYPPASKP